MKVGMRASLDTIDAALRTAGELREWEYVKDAHFRTHMLGGLDSMDKEGALLASLDKGCERRWPWKPYPGCSKAFQMRQWLSRDFCYGLPRHDAAQIALSSARRLHCGCHETGSFASSRRHC